MLQAYGNELNRAGCINFSYILKYNQIKCAKYSHPHIYSISRYKDNKLNKHGSKSTCSPFSSPSYTLSIYINSNSYNETTLKDHTRRPPTMVWYGLHAKAQYYSDFITLQLYSIIAEVIFHNLRYVISKKLELLKRGFRIHMDDNYDKT